MADEQPAQATAAPALPAYLTDAPRLTQTIAWTDQQVALFDFSFLGKRFSPGVNEEMTRRLRAAQLVLHQKCLAEKQQTNPAITEVSESDFGLWCWDNQEPSVGNKPQLGGIQAHLGLKDQKNPRSRHSSGSGIDLNLFFNPYFPVRTGKVLGGEIHKVPKAYLDDHPGTTPASFHQQHIWGPAMSCYDRAHSLFNGKPADVSADSDFDHAEQIYYRFKRLSYSLQAYFRYAFVDGKRTPLPRDEFKAKFLADMEFFDPDAIDAEGNKLVPKLESPEKDATLDKYYDKIVSDYRVMQLATVSGAVVIGDDGSMGFEPGRQQRDPCKGIFNVRQEVFVELVKTQKLRWGGAMFGTNSGDAMHFDLDGHFVNGEKRPDPPRKTG